MINDFFNLMQLFMQFSLIFQLFYSFFKSIIGKEVIVELKNDLRYFPIFIKNFSFLEIIVITVVS